MTEDFVVPGRMEKELCRDAVQKEIISENMLKEIVEKIAVIITNTVLVLNPEIVILGGIASRFNCETIHTIESVLQRTCPFVPRIVVSKLGIDAPVIGGVKVALEGAEKQLITYWK